MTVQITENLELVEWAWYEVTKGEIALTGDDADAPLAALALRLWQEVEDYTNTVDVEATDIEEYADRAIALRVARALSILWYGETN